MLYVLAVVLLIGAIGPSQAHFGLLAGGGGCHGGHGGHEGHGGHGGHGGGIIHKGGGIHKGGSVGWSGGGGGHGGSDEYAEGGSSYVEESAGSVSRAGHTSSSQESESAGSSSSEGSGSSGSYSSEGSGSSGSSNSQENESARKYRSRETESEESRSSSRSASKEETSSTTKTEAASAGGKTEVDSSNVQKRSTEQETATESSKIKKREIETETGYAADTSGSSDRSSTSEDSSADSSSRKSRTAKSNEKTTSASASGSSVDEESYQGTSSGSGSSGSGSSDSGSSSSSEVDSSSDTSASESDASSLVSGATSSVSESGVSTAVGAASGVGSRRSGRSKRSWNLKEYEWCIGKNWGRWFDNYDGNENEIADILRYVIEDIKKWEKPTHIDIFVGYIFKCGLTIHIIFDGIIRGLGEAIWKVLAAILQLAVCTTEGLLSFLFGSGYKAKVCSIGCAPRYGLKGGLSRVQIFGIMDKGWKECYGHWKRFNGGKGWKGTDGLIKLVLTILEDILNITKKCKASGSINISLFTSLWTKLSLCITGLATHYEHDQGLIGHFENIFGVFGKHGYNCNDIRKYSSGCRKGHGLLHLKHCYH